MFSLYFLLCHLLFLLGNIIFLVSIVTHFSQPERLSIEFNYEPWAVINLCVICNAPIRGQTQDLSIAIRSTLSTYHGRQQPLGWLACALKDPDGVKSTYKKQKDFWFLAKHLCHSYRLEDCFQKSCQICRLFRHPLKRQSQFSSSYQTIHLAKRCSCQCSKLVSCPWSNRINYGLWNTFFWTGLAIFVEKIFFLATFRAHPFNFIENPTYSGKKAIILAELIFVSLRWLGETCSMRDPCLLMVWPDEATFMLDFTDNRRWSNSNLSALAKLDSGDHYDSYCKYL